MYKVDNAVIMAAGTSSRFALISYGHYREKPAYRLAEKPWSSMHWNAIFGEREIFKHI